MNKNKYSELTSNTLLFGISTVSVKLLSFLLTPLYTTSINAELMGEITILTSTIALLIPILTLGFNIGIMRYMLDKNKNEGEILGSLLTVWMLANIVLLISIPLLDKVPLFSTYKLYFCLIFILNSFDVLIAQYIRGAEKLRIFAVAGILATLTLGISNIILLLFMKLSAEGYLLSIIISHLASITFLSFFGLRKINIKSIKINLENLKEIAKFSIPFVPNSVSWWINNASDKYIIIMYLGAASTGIYSVANKIPALLVAITAVFNQAWQISAIKEYESDNVGGYYSNVMQKYTSFLSLICSLLVFISPVLAKFLFLNEYYSAWKYVPFLLIAMQMGSLANFYDAIIISTKKTKSVFWATVFGAIVNIILNIILIPLVGMTGAAFATMFSYTLIFISKVFLAKKMLGTTYLNKVSIIIFLLLIIQSILQTWFDSFINVFSLLIFSIIIVIVYKDIISIIKQILNKRILKKQ